MSIDAWKEATYDRIFQENHLALEKRRAAEPSLDRAEIEGILNHLYVQEGNDQGGRGELGDMTVRAAIAAYESFLASWK